MKTSIALSFILFIYFLSVKLVSSNACYLEEGEGTCGMSEEDRQRLIFKKLTNKIRAYNGTVSKMELHFINPTNRIIRASENITKGEIILEIPKHFMISENNPLFKNETDICLSKNLTVNLCIAKILMDQTKKGEQSIFKEVIDLLPKSFPSYPLYFSEDEVNMMNNSFLNESYASVINSYDNYFEEFQKHIDTEKKISKKVFIKFMVATNTRVFGLYDDTVGMIAIADMLNHQSFDYNIRWDSKNKTETFRMKALVDIEKGEELLDSYGASSNMKLLMNYGFICDTNEGEGSLYIEDEYYTLKLNRNLTHFKKNFEKIVDTFEETSKIEDRRLFAFREFKEKIKTKLRMYETTIQEDNKILAKDLSFNQSNILRIIKEEKFILRTTLSVVEFFLATLEFDRRTKYTIKTFPFPHLHPFYNDLLAVN